MGEGYQSGPKPVEDLRPPPKGPGLAMGNPPTKTQAAQRALDALKIQNAITSLASRFDPLLVMTVARDWLAYMDAQVARIDGERVPQTLDDLEGL